VSLASTAFGQVGADGIDWVTVGAPGNASYAGISDPLSPTFGRGAVDYEYRMGRLEVTTAQWLEFYNAALARPDPLPMSGQFWWGPPVLWGAVQDGSYTGPGMRYRLSSVADAALVPSSGMSWRTCAVLCNWLHNDKRTDVAAFMTGAYDVSTFTPETGRPTFNDQRTRSPGARYWIPNLDEYVKAAFYDPNRFGQAQGGYWAYSHSSDTAPVYGPPIAFGGDGTGQANAVFRLSGNAQNRIPLGSYGSVQTPWGLLDVAGASQEWLEDFWESADGLQLRLVDGSSRGSSGGYIDSLMSYGQDTPSFRIGDRGFRLASSVPAPGAMVIISSGLFVLGRRERRSRQCVFSASSRQP
jgi:hypothetical protein